MAHGAVHRRSKSESGRRRANAAKNVTRITAKPAAPGETAAHHHPLTPPENTMTRDQESQVQELTPEQLELVAGGSMMETLRLMLILSNIAHTRSETSMTFARNTRA